MIINDVHRRESSIDYIDFYKKQLRPHAKEHHHELLDSISEDFQSVASVNNTSSQNEGRATDPQDI